MMGPVTNIGTMNKELISRIRATELEYGCGSSGNFLSDTAIVAEAPGEREIELKMPLCGGSGKMLWDILRAENISRGSVYSTNVVKRKIVNTLESRKSPINKQELGLWKQILIDELSLLPNLKYIIVLGNIALHALIGEEGIKQWRGSVVPISFNGRSYQAIISFNPAFIIREPRNEIVFRMDMNKLTRVKAGTFSPERFTSIINPSYEQAMEYINDLQRTDDPIVYDIETISRATACIGFAPSVNGGICIPFHDGRTNYFTHEEEQSLRLAIQSLFSSKRHRFIAQNANFDMSWLWFMDRIRVRSTWFDTMLAHHALYPPLPHNLGFLTAQYTDRSYYKDDGKKWKLDGDINKFWEYNVEDCVVTYLAYKKLHQELIDQGMDKFFFDHIMRLQPSLVRMTVGGIKADVPLKEKITNDLREQLDVTGKLCNETAREATGIPDYSFNPRSWRDLADLFFTKLKLVGRGTSTDKENRARMLSHPRTSEIARTLITQIDDFLSKAKFLSTYASSRLDDDGRFRCEYSQIGVAEAPGRLSSRETMWENGLNLQNIPENAKVMFIADEGYEFSYFDGAQIEARFVACLADIPSWREQFELARLNPGSYDAHCALAADLYGVPYDDVPKSDFNPDGSKTIRFVSKRCRHGLNYRMDYARLATTAGLSIQEAQQAYNIYHYKHPQLREWWDQLAEQVHRSGYLESPLGRRWILMERFSPEALDSIVAFEPQSTAGDWVSRCIYMCESDPDWPADARMMLNIHDALVAINRPADGPLVRSIMKKYMEEPLVINGYPMIVPAEFGVSQPDEYGVHRWSTIKKIK